MYLEIYIKCIPTTSTPAPTIIWINTRALITLKLKLKKEINNNQFQFIQ